MRWVNTMGKYVILLSTSEISAYIIGAMIRSVERSPFHCILPHLSSLSGEYLQCIELILFLSGRCPRTNPT